MGSERKKSIEAVSTARASVLSASVVGCPEMLYERGLVVERFSAKISSRLASSIHFRGGLAKRSIQDSDFGMVPLRVLCSLFVVQMVRVELGQGKGVVVLTCMLPCEGTCTFAGYHASIAQHQNTGCWGQSWPPSRHWHAQMQLAGWN